MAKRLLLVCLGICVVASAGCAELRRLRRQNANLLEQLSGSDTQRKAALGERDALVADRTTLGAELAAALRQAKEADRLVGDLQRERMKLDEQRRVLQQLVSDIGGDVVTRAEGNFIVYESDILFAPGKIVLTEDAKKSLAKIAQYLMEQDDLPVRVDGHTDGVPISVSEWKDNYHLAAMRSHAVMRYLAEQGVSLDRMHIAGFGPNKPSVEPEEPTMAVPQNRRVEILLVPPAMRSVSEILEAFQD